MLKYSIILSRQHILCYASCKRDSGRRKNNYKEAKIRNIKMLILTVLSGK